MVFDAYLPPVNTNDEVAKTQTDHNETKTSQNIYELTAEKVKDNLSKLSKKVNNKYDGPDKDFQVEVTGPDTIHVGEILTYYEDGGASIETDSPNNLEFSSTGDPNGNWYPALTVPSNGIFYARGKAAKNDVNIFSSTGNTKVVDVVEQTTPLDLLSFSAKINKDTLEVDWETVNLMNVEKTEVEISADGGEDFVPVAKEEYETDHREKLTHQQKIALQDIIRKLKEAKEYDPSKKDYLVRLNTTNEDGSSETSKVLSIHLDLEKGEVRVRVVPNPASANRPLNLQLQGVEARDVKSVDILTMVGKKVSHFDNIESVNTNHLKEGMYIIRITTKNGKVITKKLQI